MEIIAEDRIIYPGKNDKKKIKNDLENNILPIINPLSEKYFKKRFLNKMVESITVWPNVNISGRIELRKGEKKWRMYIGTPENINDDWFNKYAITGKGIETISHEYSHLYLFDKFSLEEYENLDSNLVEGFCDFSAFEIIKKSDSSRLREAQEYVKKYESLFVKDIGTRLWFSWETNYKNKEYPYNDERRLAHQLFYHNPFSKKPIEILQNKKDFEEFIKHHKYYAFSQKSRGKKTSLIV